MVLALNERGGLARVLLFWGALGRQKERAKTKAGVFPSLQPLHFFTEGRRAGEKS